MFDVLVLGVETYDHPFGIRIMSEEGIQFFIGENMGTLIILVALLMPAYYVKVYDICDLQIHTVSVCSCDIFHSTIQSEGSRSAFLG